MPKFYSHPKYINIGKCHLRVFAKFISGLNLPIFVNFGIKSKMPSSYYIFANFIYFLAPFSSEKYTRISVNTHQKHSHSILLIPPNKKMPSKNSNIFSAICLLFLCCLTLIANGQFILTAADEKRNFGREFLPFGKRAPAPSPADAFQRDFMAFGKRTPSNDAAAFQRDFMAFGKRSSAGADAFQRDFMAFGKRVPDPFQRDFMAFGKRAANTEGFERDFMAFGRRK